MDRPSFHEMIVDIAIVVARRSTCDRLRVGAVVAQDNQIVSTGYNGAPRGMPHCDHKPGDGSCERVVHAEVNALLRAGRDAKGSTLYVTHYPCVRCWPVVVNAGVRAVVYQELYGELQPDYEKVVSVGHVVRYIINPYECVYGFSVKWRGRT